MIELQICHLPNGKVGKAYDGCQYLDERKEFLEKWGELLVQKGLKI